MTAPAQDIDAIRSEVRAWLQENWSLEITLREWWRRLGESGWAFPTWPSEWYGKDMNGEQATAVRQQIRNAGAIAAPHGIGQTMGAPVILQFGTPEQKRHFMPALATGTEAWCQFFSEPNAGSDLASLQTRAVRDGDEWVVNGQKVWNSGTMTSERAVLVARTDSSVPKHRGLSFFIIDVEQPGLEVRPIQQLNGEAHFNETFFSDARVSHDALIGGEGNGWNVTLATLANERSSYAAGADYGQLVAPGERGGMLDHTVGDIIKMGPREKQAWTAFPLGDTHAMVDLAREYGRIGEAQLRQQIMKMYCMAEAARLTAARAKAAADAGRAPGPESSLGYLAGVLIARASRDLGLGILGAHGMLAGEAAPRNGAVAMMALTSLVHGIQGGSEQIQRNILGERVLGLPKEPQVDRDTPFNQLVVGTQRR